MTADFQPVPTDLLGREEPKATSTDAVLSVKDLCVRFPTDDGLVHAVENVTFDLHANETLGIVGESGSGKSVTSMAILGLLPKTAEITGSIRFRGTEILGLPESQLRPYRGQKIAMIFQDALTALNPVYTVGKQIAESIEVHHKLSRHELHEQSVALLDLVGIPNPKQRFDQYPHEYSGGMRQRAMIAMMIANEPDVLIADEPTTALDVTIQAQVLDVIERIQDRMNSSIMLITHDLGVVAGVAERVMVMYAGRQVETGPVDEIFYTSRHPYTQGLLASLPRLDDRTGGGEKLYRIKGQPPSLIFLPPGCAFNPRCPHALAGTCDTVVPSLEIVEPGHRSSCLRRDEIPVGVPA
ncbi:MAG TPA: ABC transporter ATP-binding protein [Acidimicrobiia bacterium]|jgi:oligopeptide/dipeptide ABC transporter ATP-binding protein